MLGFAPISAAPISALPVNDLSVVVVPASGGGGWASVSRRRPFLVPLSLEINVAGIESAEAFGVPAVGAQAEVATLHSQGAVGGASVARVGFSGRAVRMFDEEFMLLAA